MECYPAVGITFAFVDVDVAAYREVSSGCLGYQTAGNV